MAKTYGTHFGLLTGTPNDHVRNACADLIETAAEEAVAFGRSYIYKEPETGLLEVVSHFDLDTVDGILADCIVFELPCGEDTFFIEAYKGGKVTERLYLPYDFIC